MLYKHKLPIKIMRQIRKKRDLVNDSVEPPPAPAPPPPPPRPRDRHDSEASNSSGYVSEEFDDVVESARSKMKRKGYYLLPEDEKEFAEFIKKKARRVEPNVQEGSSENAEN